jgi:hypothetical protein
MSTRQSLFFIIVGTNGTGKTTLLNKLISEKGGKSLIIDPDGMEWGHVQEIEPEKCGELKSGQAKILAPTIEDLEHLLDFQNGSLVLDDCRFYLKSRMDESIRRILIRRRQNRAVLMFLQLLMALVKFQLLFILLQLIWCVLKQMTV